MAAVFFVMILKMLLFQMECGGFGKALLIL